MWGARGVTLCVGLRVHFISFASSWYILHDTCLKTWLSRQQITKHVSVLSACHAAEISLWWKRYYWKVGGDKLKLSVHNCTVWWILHKSHLCSAGGDSPVSEVENKTNISWDMKPVMMKFSSHRNSWIQNDMVCYGMEENTLDDGEEGWQGTI